RCHADIGIADRKRIDIGRLEVWADRRHEIHGVGAYKAAVHALALPQHGVGDLDRAIGGLVTTWDIGAEHDDDRWHRRDRAALQVDLRERQRAGHLSERFVDEQARDIIL